MPKVRLLWHDHCLTKLKTWFRTLGGIGFRTDGKYLIVSTKAIGNFGNKSGKLLNGNFVASATNPPVRR
jgi:hypothetical protein